jgi:hypothetical protein
MPSSTASIVVIGSANTDLVVRVPSLPRPGETVIEWGPWIDTAALYRQLYPTVGTGRLEALVVAAGVQGQLDALAAQHCPPTRRRSCATLCTRACPL